MINEAKDKVSIPGLQANILKARQAWSASNLDMAVAHLN